MQHMDADYVREAIQRLKKIPEDASPRWGHMRKKEMIEHLIWAVKHSMGRSTQVPYFGNWFTEHILGPVFLQRWFPMPRNVRFPHRLTAQGVTAREPGDEETLHALLEEYLNLVQADELHPAPHVVFGNIGVDGWDRMHTKHFEHHLRQFGV